MRKLEGHPSLTETLGNNTISLRSCACVSAKVCDQLHHGEWAVSKSIFAAIAWTHLARLQFRNAHYRDLFFCHTQGLAASQMEASVRIHPLSLQQHMDTAGPRGRTSWVHVLRFVACIRIRAKLFAPNLAW